MELRRICLIFYFGLFRSRLVTHQCIVNDQLKPRWNRHVRWHSQSSLRSEVTDKNQGDKGTNRYNHESECSAQLFGEGDEQPPNLRHLASPVRFPPLLKCPLYSKAVDQYLSINHFHTREVIRSTSFLFNSFSGLL